MIYTALEWFVRSLFLRTLFPIQSHAPNCKLPDTEYSSNIWYGFDCRQNSHSLTRPIVQIVDLDFTMSASYSICEIPIPLNVSEDSCTLIDAMSKISFGCLGRDSRKILEVLQKKVSIQLFADKLDLVARKKTRTSRTKSNNLDLGIVLCAILYGAQSLFEPVGLFVAKCKLFLQHPRNCDRNVQYRNPHCLSPQENKYPYTYNLDDALRNDAGHTLKIPLNPIDLLADAVGQGTLVGTKTPQTLRTILYNHQMQALTFMIQRERGWAIDGRGSDIWATQKDAYGRTLYLNTIAGQKQTRPPQQFRGGLLIDAPGLGKSLSIISLIASDCHSEAQGDCKGASQSTTLLVVPKTRKAASNVSRHSQSTKT